mmetsp:Transcript_54671/g.98202  ORF Transcript_54671/g.98202 Transcript_54671/m.98202 type:complete len:266 (+) Transcript_54671:62-859(+)
MGSIGDAIVRYDRSRSRSPSRSKYRSRSRRRTRSRSKDKTFTFQSERARAAAERVTQQKFAKEQADARVEAAVKSVEAAQKALETATAASIEAANKLQDLTKEANQIEHEDRIQSLVNEREDARRAKKMEKAKDLESVLRGMGVQVSDHELTWNGPGGLSGQVKEGIKMRPGDWKCPSCHVVVFNRNKKCFRCGTPKPGEGGGDGGDRGGRGRGRRSPSYDRFCDRRGGGGGGGRREDDRRGGGDRGGRRRRSPSSSPSSPNYKR